MRKIIVIISIFVLLGVGCKRISNKESDLNKQANNTIGRFFEGLKSGDSSAAKDLLGSNSNFNLKDSSIQDLLVKFSFLNRVSGNIISDTLLNKKTLNDNIGVYCYLVRYDKKFYRFTFVFYNNGKTVKIYRFSFDETIDIEMEEGLKMYS